MLTIRGADQACTSLRAARKSLGDGGAIPNPRMAELDLIIGELVVGAPSYRGNASKSKGEIETLVTLLSRVPEDATASMPDGDRPALSGEIKPVGPPPGLNDALGHFRRAVATLQRFIDMENLPRQ